MHKTFFTQNISEEIPTGGGYGYLYNWYAASDINFAPTDWVVPTYSQYTTLLSNLGGTSIAGGKMKESGLDHWNSPNTGATNSSGFTAYGASFRTETGAFGVLGNFSYLATSTLFNPTQSYMIKLNTNDDNSDIQGPVINYGLSIRLLYTGAGTPMSVTDNDGNVYDVVQIGSQYWTVQNWKCTTLDDGTSIPNVTDNTAWSNLTTLGRCAYDNDESNV